MKSQSTLEYVVLLTGIIAAVLLFFNFVYKNFNNTINNEKNITVNNMNIYSFDLYLSQTSNILKGSFYQNGGNEYKNGKIKLKISNSVYSIPISFFYYNSTLAKYGVDFESNTLSPNVLNSIYIGEPYTLIAVNFQNLSNNYIYYTNYSGIIYST